MLHPTMSFSFVTCLALGLSGWIHDRADAGTLVSRDPELQRSIEDVRFEDAGEDGVQVAVDWSAWVPRPTESAVNANFDGLISVNGHVVEVLELVQRAVHASCTCGDGCSGTCKSHPAGFCSCKHIYALTSTPLDLEPGDRVGVQLVPARGGLEEFDRSDNFREVVYDPSPTPRFRRGDSNGDGQFDLADAVSLLYCLFLGGDCPSCDSAADANDDGALALTDAVYDFDHLFQGGPAPRAPFSECGVDPTDDGLTCDTSQPCD